MYAVPHTRMFLSARTEPGCLVSHVFAVSVEARARDCWIVLVLPDIIRPAVAKWLEAFSFPPNHRKTSTALCSTDDAGAQKPSNRLRIIIF